MSNSLQFAIAVLRFWLGVPIRFSELSSSMDNVRLYPFWNIGNNWLRIYWEQFILGKLSSHKQNERKEKGYWRKWKIIFYIICTQDILFLLVLYSNSAGGSAQLTFNNNHYMMFGDLHSCISCISILHRSGTNRKCLCLCLYLYLSIPVSIHLYMSLHWERVGEGLTLSNWLTWLWRWAGPKSAD